MKYEAILLSRHRLRRKHVVQLVPKEITAPMHFYRMHKAERVCWDHNCITEKAVGIHKLQQRKIQRVSSGWCSHMVHPSVYCAPVQNENKD